MDDLRLLVQIIRWGWVQIVRDQRGPAGFIARDGSRIHALYVHPNARGRGLGQTLLDEAKKHMPRLELYVAQANCPARHFYTSQGFSEAARGNGAGNDENLPDILMVWQTQHKAMI